MKPPRSRLAFGDAHVDQLITQALASVGSDENDDLVRALLVTAFDMDAANIDRLELKIAAQALAEMLTGWETFSPYRTHAKVSVFGSARSEPEHPDYALAVEFGHIMAQRRWMVITGAGPGIMTAGIEGAGAHNSFGVNIALPFEQAAADIIADDPKLATFKYFFTRKLTFMKESDAFALFPGGFGTLDEAFELLTLVQTGKTYPTPIVLIDHAKSTYWANWRRFVHDELLDRSMVSAADMDLVHHTHNPHEAADRLCDFYSCYHSLRYVGNRLILRLNAQLAESAIDKLNDEFGDLVEYGRIETTSASDAELEDDDHVGLDRIALRFNQQSFSRLVKMIHRINELSGRSERNATEGLIHDVSPDPVPQTF